MAAVSDTMAAIEADGGTATACTVDISAVESVSAMVHHAVDTYGRLDIAFNNAGISHKLASLHEADVDEWQRVIAVNLTGAFLCLRAEIAVLVAQGTGGAIVCTSSGAGVVAASDAGRVHRGEARCARPREGRGAGVRRARPSG